MNGYTILRFDRINNYEPEYVQYDNILYETEPELPSDEQIIYYLPSQPDVEICPHCGSHSEIDMPDTECTTPMYKIVPDYVPSWAFQ